MLGDFSDCLRTIGEIFDLFATWLFCAAGRLMKASVRRYEEQCCTRFDRRLDPRAAQCSAQHSIAPSASLPLSSAYLNTRPPVLHVQLGCRTCLPIARQGFSDAAVLDYNTSTIDAESMSRGSIGDARPKEGCCYQATPP